MNYHGIIFCFNGVLLWDAEWHVLCWQGMAKRLRGRDLTAEELERQVHGRCNADVLSYLVGRPVRGKELADLAEEKESFYRELCLMNPRRFLLSPGAQALLDALASQRVPRTIATSSEFTNTQFFIQHLGLDRWFEVDEIVYHDGRRIGKPAPDVYLEAARRIRVEPHWCVAVEDSTSGLASAQAAGMGCIVALGPSGTHGRLKQVSGVSYVIQSLRDFPREILGLEVPGGDEEG